MSAYTYLIGQALAAAELEGYSPRHIEAWMREASPTLDGLSPERFRFEVEVAAANVDTGGEAFAEALANASGL